LIYVSINAAYLYMVPPEMAGQLLDRRDRGQRIPLIGSIAALRSRSW
jgi:hypothetical protein